MSANLALATEYFDKAKAILNNEGESSLQSPLSLAIIYLLLAIYLKLK